MAAQKYIRSSKGNNRWQIIALAVIVLVAGSGALLYKSQHPADKDSSNNIRPTNTVNYSPPSSSENDAGNERKSSTSPATTLDNGTSTKSTTSTTFTDSIVSASSANNNVHIATLVSGTTDGSCTLTASMQGQSNVVRTSTVQRDVNSYDCGVFNIPTSYFPAKGTWTLTLTVSNNGQQASTTSSVEI